MKVLFGFLACLFICASIWVLFDWMNQKVYIEQLKYEISNKEDDLQLIKRANTKELLAAERRILECAQKLQSEQAARVADKENYQQQIQLEKANSYQNGWKESAAVSVIDTKRLLWEKEKEMDSIHISKMEEILLKHSDLVSLLEHKIRHYKRQYNIAQTQLEKIKAKKSWFGKYISNSMQAKRTKNRKPKRHLPLNEHFVIIVLLLICCFLTSGAVVRLRFEGKRR